MQQVHKVVLFAQMGNGSHKWKNGTLHEFHIIFFLRPRSKLIFNALLSFGLFSLLSQIYVLTT
jgi:hypothetical protein